MALFNVFSDPKLRARQDQLDAQWKSLNGLQNVCPNVPDTAWVEFVNDLKKWNEFYESGSDWTADSANATNDWQRKAQEWADRLAGWGCGGSGGNAEDKGIPGVKDPPPDEKSFIDKIPNPLKGIESTLGILGWVAIGLTLLVVGGLIYVLTHAKGEGFGVKVG